MPSQSVVFDIPQNRPPVPHAFYRDVEYDHQQITISPRKLDFAIGASLDERVLSYVYDHLQPNKDFTAQLRALHQHYTILDDDCTVIEFLETEPAIYSLL